MSSLERPSFVIKKMKVKKLSEEAPGQALFSAARKHVLFKTDKEAAYGQTVGVSDPNRSRHNEMHEYNSSIAVASRHDYPRICADAGGQSRTASRFPTRPYF